jgi:hypothetical protein
MLVFLIYRILYLVLAAVLCRVHKIIHELYYIVNGLGLSQERNDADAEVTGHPFFCMAAESCA